MKASGVMACPWMRATARSSRSWPSIDDRSAPRPLAQLGTSAVALAAVLRIEIIKESHDLAGIPACQPLEWSHRKVKAELHRSVGRILRAHALLHGVRR